LELAVIPKAKAFDCKPVETGSEISRTATFDITRFDCSFSMGLAAGIS
jgi:hypothetical protein